MPDIDIDFSIRGRERVIRYVQDKYGRDAVAQIITFGKMKPRAATRDAARVLGVDYATGDRLAKLIPEPIMGRTPSFEECMAPGTDLRKAYDTEPQAQQVVDVARGLEGIVRNNSIHAAAVVIADRPLTEIVPLQLAEDRGAVEVPCRGRERQRRQARARLQDGDAVLDEADRGDRPAEDGLPGIAHAGRARERGRDHRALRRRADRPHEPAARRPQDLRDARARRLGGRVPARVRGHAGGAARGRADRVRRHRRAGRALPARADALHQGLRARQARPGDRALHRRAAEVDHRAHVRHRGLPGAADADRARHRRLPGPEGGHAAPRDRQEGARADGDAQAGLRRGLHARAAPTRRSRTSSGA